MTDMTRGNGIMDTHILLSLEELEDLDIQITDDFELQTKFTGKKENLNLDYYDSLIY